MTLYPIAPSGVSAQRVHYMQPNRTVASNFVLDATTLTLIYRRQRPLITVQASQSTNITGSCTIAGRIIDAP